MEPLNLAYLQTHLQRIDVLLRLAVQRARAAGFDPDNEFQGLYVADDEIARHLSLPPGAGLWGAAGLATDEESQQQLEQLGQALQKLETEARQTGVQLRLLTLAAVLGFSAIDLDILLICLAPELDRRYERIYGFLQDDVTRRRPTIRLVMNLLGIDWLQRTRLLDRLIDESPLMHEDVLTAVNDPADPHTVFVNRLLKVDGRIVQYVQGIDNIPHQWRTLIRQVYKPDIDDIILDENAHQMVYHDYGDLRPIFHIYGNYGSGQRSIARMLAQDSPLIEVNLQAARQEANGGLRPIEWAFREGRLRQATLLLSHWNVVLDDSHDPPQWLWDAVLDYPHIVVLSSKEGWEPRGVERQRPVLRLPLEVPDFDARQVYWLQFLGEIGVDPSELAYKFKLTGGQIRDAVYTAFDLAMGRGATVPTLNDLYAASRAQSNRKLSDMAVKIPPGFTWEQIVLPHDRVQQLHEICDQVRYAVQVYDRWGFKGRGSNAQGLTALFAGQSGTGKTMAAEIIAGELGLELFKIDLSSVVSKYIGETEKNLAAIFDEATQSNAILFFDEADALFGKRSEVKDSHDRYANIEIGYLLQRMETYDGVAILASNLRQNLDEAFTRRLDFLIDFPFPEEEDRLKIWQISFPQNAPLNNDVEIGLLAQRYRLAGGNIRNAALAAAFLAAADDSSTIRMHHVLQAIRREHQKMGKLMEDELSHQYLN